MIRKFFDPAAAEAKAETPKFELAGEIDINDVFAGMNGQNQEVKVEEKKEDKPEEKKEEVKQEQKPEEKTEVKEEKKPEQPVVTDWKELVKKADRKEVFSLLEIDETALNLSNELKQDDFVNKLITYRKEHGNLTPFIEAATKDWDKVSHLDLLRDDLRRQYPKLSEEKFAILSKNNIDKRFILGDDAPEEDADLASVLLETEAEKIRAARKSEQQQFLDSVKPVDRTAEAERAAKDQQEAMQKEFERFGQMIDAHPSFQRLNTDKKIVLGTKENPISYVADPALIRDQAVMPSKFHEKFWAKDAAGNEVFDFDKWARVVAYSENPAAFEAELISKAIKKGEDKIVDELENPSKKTDDKPKSEKKSLAKTFAEEGQPITLQELYGG